jgi:hypothetical protein
MAFTLGGGDGELGGGILGELGDGEEEQL